MKIWIELRQGLWAQLDESELVGIPTAKIDSAKTDIIAEIIKRYE